MSYATTFYLTAKQQEIMDAVLRLTGRGEFPDMDELLDAVSYKCSKQAMQFSVRYLARHGLLEKKEPELRRGRRRAVIAPTKLAYDLLRVDYGSADMELDIDTG